MREGLKKARWISLIIGILLIITGVIFFTNPVGSLISLAYLIACMFIATGILRVIRYFTGSIFRSGSFLILSILDILLGIAMLYTQPFTAITLAMFLGFWEMFTGVSEIAISIDLKQIEMPRWWLGILSGILGIILGVMIIKTPALSSLFIAIYAIIYGLTFVSTFFALRKFKE